MMNDELRFHKHIEMWSRLHPKEAFLLGYQDDGHLHFCKTRQGELNLCCREGDHPVYYHSSQGALAEAERQFAKYNLKGKQVLYVYGVGLGYLFDAAREWLKKSANHFLIFLEDDLAVIKKLFETERATALLQHPQVQLIYFSDVLHSVEAFEAMYWNYILTQMEFGCLPFYKKTKNVIYEELKEKITYDAAIKNALVEEYLKYGAGFFKNFYPNLLSLHSSYLGNQSFGFFPQVPAVICGAGPSLEKSLPHLQSLQHKAIIFAGGSALNVLTAHEIRPHFGAGIDPNTTQYERLKTSTGYEVPFYYRNRLLHAAFKLITGPRLYITGAGGYDVADWFEEQLKIKGEYLDEGHNIVNFCLEIAYRLGCNPIIFAGMDLAFTGMRAYAVGIEGKAKVSRKSLTETKDFDTSALLRPGIDGKPVYTLWKWIAESNWIGDFAKTHPDVTLINATEGGIGFPGVPNMTFKEAVEKYLHRSYDIHGRIHGMIQNCQMPQVTEKKVDKLIRTLRASLERSIGHFDTLLQEGQATIAKLQEHKAIPKILQSGQAALAEHELEDEPAYQYILDLFNAVYSRILNRELQALQRKRYAPWKRAVKRIELNKRRWTFLRHVAVANATLIDWAFEGKKKEQAECHKIVTPLKTKS